MNIKRMWPLIAAAILILTIVSFLYFPKTAGKGAGDILRLAVKAQSADEKISLYEKAATLPGASKSERFAAASALASAYKEQGKNDEAEKWFEAALKYGVKEDPTYQSTLVQYADLLLQADKSKRAAELLGRSIETITEPGLKNVALDRYAAALVRTGKFKEAVKQYETLLELTPETESFILTINYADTVSRCREHEKALDILDSLHPTAKEQRSTILWTRAEIFVRMDQKEKAVAYFLLVAEDPETPPGQQADAMLKIASIYISQKDTARADEALMKAFEKKADPNQIALRVIELSKSVNPQKQDGIFSQWIKRLDKHANAQVLLMTEQGKLALKLNRKKNALQIFQEALKLAEGKVEKEWLQQMIMDIESENAVKKE